MLPEPIRALARDVAAGGGRAYLVGGGVRDHLMAQPVKDWDLEVFGLDVDALARILKRRGAVNAVGRSFGVLKWKPRGGGEEEYDVSIPRRDSKVGPGHRGIRVEGDPDMTLEEAVRRRDLTINALMWDLEADRLVDPAGGLADLRAGRLRAVDDTTFLEDPLRALRVVQFAARLEFLPDPGLVALCRAAPLEELPAERIQGEWGKLLLKGRRPSLGLAVAREADLLARVFPEVAGIRTDAVLDRLAAGPRAEMGPEGRAWALMLAGWLHPASPEAAVATLDRLWLHQVRGYPTRDRALAAIAAWSRPVDDDAALRRLSTACELRLTLALRGAILSLDPRGWLGRAEALGILERAPAPLLQGRDLQRLGVKPGPQMGRLLAAVYAQQLDGAVTTPEQALEAARALTAG